MISYNSVISEGLDSKGFANFKDTGDDSNGDQCD